MIHPLFLVVISGFPVSLFHDLLTTYYIYTVWQGVEVLPDIAAVKRIDVLCCRSIVLNAFDAGSGVVDIVKGYDAGRGVVSNVAEGLVGRQLFGFIGVVPG